MRGKGTQSAQDAPEAAPLPDSGGEATDAADGADGRGLAQGRGVLRLLLRWVPRHGRWAVTSRNADGWQAGEERRRSGAGVRHDRGRGGRLAGGGRGLTTAGGPQGPQDARRAGLCLVRGRGLRAQGARLARLWAACGRTASGIVSRPLLCVSRAKSAYHL